jgi:hypothetical protein
VPELALGQALLARLPEAELHRVVTVALLAANGGDEAGPGLHHGHALDVPVLGIEDLRHAQLASK